MNIFTLLLSIHIATGFISLALGLYIMMAKKGDKLHKKTRKIYFYSMMINSIMAIPMSYLHPNLFLFLIAVWTLYMLLTGKRYLVLKSTKDVVPRDWALLAISTTAAVVFLFLGIKLLIHKNNFGIVVITFALLMTMMVVQDYINFKGKSKIKNYWITTHIQRMAGSYIATTTAFLVVNNTVLPAVFAWLLPTMVFTPLLVWWVRKWEVK